VSSRASRLLAPVLNLRPGVEQVRRTGVALLWAYGSTLTTANITITFTGTIVPYVVSGKVTTTTPTPFSIGNSIASSGGTTSPQTVAATTGSGGIPANGVGLITRNFTSVTPNQDFIANNFSSVSTDAAMGHSTTSGSTSGATFTSTVSGTFTAWAAISWGP
jgi:hypothetical protein